MTIPRTSLVALAIILSVSTKLFGAGTVTVDNTLLGDGAGASLTLGVDNALIGVNAGAALTTGSFNTFVGDGAGQSNTMANGNTFVGQSAGLSNSTGNDNIFIGKDAGLSNSSGFYNTFTGQSAGRANTQGWRNTFIGQNAGLANNLGTSNTFIGNDVGMANTTGVRNTFIGNSAGLSNNTGSDNVFIGNGAGGNENSSEKLYIQNFTSSSPLIYGEFDNDIVGINGTLGVGTQMPSATLHVRRADGSTQLLVEETSATTAARTLLNLQNNGRSEIVMGNPITDNEWAFGASSHFILKHGAFGSTSGDKTRYLKLFSNTGNLEIAGSIITGGPSCGSGCDAVFSDNYKLPSISEHAKEMYARGHLPNVGPTAPDQPVNLTEQMGNLLNELEHAHIYIAQLEQNTARQQSELASYRADITSQNAILASLIARLEQLEASQK